MIPNNITKEHIVSAINEIEKNGYPIIREPTKYYIKYNEKTYPAKYIISIANKFANGQELISTGFGGGTETNEFLKSRGFEIVTEDKSKENSPNKKFDLEKLILEYDKNKDFFGKRKITEEKAMQLRSQFIADFPQDKILNLNLERYAFGIINKDSGTLDESTFCFRLEYRMPGFGGIRGTPANKFGIYFDRKKQKYVYDEKKFASPDESFKKIITEINYLLQSAKQFSADKNWDKMSQIFEKEYEIQNHVKSKILAVYFPESFALIHSNKRIKRMLIDLFNIPQAETKEELLLNQAKLLEIKQNHPIMKDWSNFDYSTFVWRVWEDYFDSSNNSTASEQKLDKNNQLKTGFWVVRAESKGQKEKDILENNIITINWSAGNLSQFNDKDSLKKEFFRLNPNQTKRSIEMISSELWKFAKEIKKGDIVILPQLAKGSNHNIAIAQVIDDYRYREDLPGIKNTRPVIWLHKNIPIHEFADVAKELFNIPLTVYRISKLSAIQSIIETMQKYKILPKELQELQIDKTKSTELQQIEDKNYIESLEHLSEILFMPFEKLKIIEELLEERKQLIFYGPPGTSKTFVAKKFANYFTKNSECVEIIQFHQSYSYEDFIEGIKPKLSAEGEAIGFVKQSGIFKNLVDKCIKNSDKKFVLIIDEINRGNISKIFGELIYLLEYRNEKIHLTYSPMEEFYIPKNLYIIGTMNSADRSIAFVDYALRRRFYFIEFYPYEDILRKWFMKNGIKELYQNIILELMIEINNEISKKLGREYQIGYSYFMINNLDYEKVKRIIDYAIVPLIEQYFFGKKENVDAIRNICNTYLIRLQDLEETRKEKNLFLKDSLESFSS